MAKVNIKSPRDRQLKVRLTEAEYALLANHAKNTGQTMASLAREKLQIDTENPPQEISRRHYVQVDPELIRQISRLGKNLNQIARKVNHSGVTDPLDLIVHLLSIERRLKQIQDAHQIS